MRRRSEQKQGVVGENEAGPQRMEVWRKSGMRDSKRRAEREILPSLAVSHVASPVGRPLLDDVMPVGCPVHSCGSTAGKPPSSALLGLLGPTSPPTVRKRNSRRRQGYHRSCSLVLCVSCFLTSENLGTERFLGHVFWICGVRNGAQSVATRDFISLETRT